MPDPKDNAKGEVEFHPPEPEQRTPPEGSLGRELEDEGRAGKGINQAGFVKEKDTPGDTGKG